MDEPNLTDELQTPARIIPPRTDACVCDFPMGRFICLECSGSVFSIANPALELAERELSLYREELSLAEDLVCRYGSAMLLFLRAKTSEQFLAAREAARQVGLDTEGTLQRMDDLATMRLLLTEGRKKATP